MKKLLAVLALCGSVMAGPELPGNVRISICSCYVSADETAYTNTVELANRSWKVGQIALKDTAIAKQDTIDMGEGVAVYQQLGIFRGFVGTAGLRNYIDTSWTTIGDSANTPFTNAEGLSSDSVVCPNIDTTQTFFGEMGKLGDSLQISTGYFSLLPDPSPLTRFKVVGQSDISGVLAVYIIINDFEGVPSWEDR